MPLVISTESIPLDTDTNGVICVRGSRVTLDSVVIAFKEGATPEEIVQQYPTLALADVYGVISYYLRRQAEVDSYLDERQNRSEGARERNEALFNSQGIRERLMARRKA